MHIFTHPKFHALFWPQFRQIEGNQTLSQLCLNGVILKHDEHEERIRMMMLLVEIAASYKVSLLMNIYVIKKNAYVF